MTETQTRQLLDVPTDQVRPDPDQPRKQFDQVEHKAMVASVKQHGILSPLTLRLNGDGYVIVAGERRFRAAVEAKLATVPAIIITTDDPLSPAVVENVVRSDLNPVEEGFAYRRMVEAGRKPKEIAKIVSRPQERVEDRITLTALPVRAQQLLIDGKINLPTGRALAWLSLQHGGDLIADALAFGVQTGRVDSNRLTSKNDLWRGMFDLQRSDMDKQVCAVCEGEGFVWPSVEEDPDEEQEATPCTECKQTGYVPLPADAERAPTFLAVPIGGYGRGEPLSDTLLYLDAAAKERIQAAHDRAVEHHKKLSGRGEHTYYQDPPGFGIIERNNDLSDAVTAGGFGIDFGGNVAATDPAWVSEYLPESYEAMVESYINPPRGGGSRGSSSTSAPTRSEQEKEQARKEREKAARDRKKGRQFNLDLGAALAQIGEAKVTTEAIKLLVGQAVEHEFRNHAYDGGYEAFGLATYQRFLRDGLPTTKAGDPIYPRKAKGALIAEIAEARKQFDKQLAAAKTPEQALAVYARFVGHGLASLAGLPNADLEGTMTSRATQSARVWVTKLLPAALQKRVPADNGIKGRSQGWS